jgi:hypothetical protein
LENNEIQFAKEEKRKHIPHVFENGDTRKQLLARSRHVVMKLFSKWTYRARMLFREYPAIEEACQVRNLLMLMLKLSGHSLKA